MPDSEDARRGATIYSVADDAGVSIATVSRVLQGSSLVSDRTRQKVVDAMDRLDYLPSGAARSLAVRQHDTQGLVLPELSGPYYAELLVGFETRAAELEQSVMVVVAGSTEDRTAAMRRLATRVDGIAVHAADTIDAARSPKPVVVIAGDVQPGVEAISAENPRSAQRLTEHLLDHGRSRLLYVGDVDIAADVRERHEGFAAAHRAWGLDAADPVPAEFREHEGEAVADRLLSGELTADALVCGNDELALALMMRLVDGGLDVPGDVAVVGWDDVMTARYVRPGLTTVRQPVRELGALAADRLYDLVNGAAPRPDRQVLPTELVLRASCGCRPAPAVPPHGIPNPDRPPPPPMKVRDR